MNIKMLGTLLKRSLSDWSDDNAQRLGAALAFYTLLSISPLVILTVAIVSLVLNKSSAQAHLLAQVQSLVGSDGRNAVQSMLASGQKASSGVFATIIGIATLAFGATGELRDALNTIWETKPEAHTSVWSLLRARVFSLGMVVSVGFILLVSLLVSAGIATITKFFGGLLPIPGFLLWLLNFGISFFGIAVVLALVLKYVPAAKVEWKDVRVGALATAFLFSVGKALLGLYLGKASPGSAYGAAGSTVVLVVWVYYSAQIFFFGAEFTHVYALSRLGTLAAGKKTEAPAASSAENTRAER